MNRSNDDVKNERRALFSAAIVDLVCSLPETGKFLSAKNRQE